MKRNVFSPQSGRPSSGSFALGNNDELGIWFFGADGHLRKLEDIEADIIRLAMELYEGRLCEVSRRLRIGRSTIYRKLARHRDLCSQGTPSD
jgi:transcriptional regulator of acetoin/glycerol metabolism